MKTGRVWIVALLGIGLAAAATLPAPPAATSLTGADRVELDFERPDAWIDSDRLSALPTAVVKAPLPRRLLSEEFAFYYEELDTRQDVSGSLKRLAFEHDQSLSDRLLDSVFDEPAEVSFWRAEGGRPHYWLLNIRRNGLEKLLEFLARASLDDRQLSHVGDLAVAAATIPMYALRLNNRDTLLLASHGDRLIVASHPGMLLAGDGSLIPARAQIAAAMLGQPADNDSPQARHFAAGPRHGAHRLSLDADLLGFGYGRFLPGLIAVQFESRDGSWTTAARLDPAGTAPLAGLPWPALPYDAAFCAGLPVAADEMAGLAIDLGADKTALAGFTGAVAACWYEDGGWQAPLFAARLADAEAARRAAPALAKLFEDWIGAREFARDDGRFPVRVETGKQGETVWRREVSARYGDRAVPQDRADAFSGARYFDVSLAVAGDTVLFSPDSERLDKALDTLARKFPAMSERLPTGRPALFAVDPAHLGALLRQATLDALPVDREPALRRIADRHLFPRYAALAGEKATAAVLPARLPEGRPAWVAVDWLALK